MKKIRIMLLLGSLLVTNPVSSKAQSITQLLEQLALDYEKLAGMKKILQEMYKSYEILNKGYGAVKDVAKGNFNLHQAYMDSLNTVSPAVRKYPRVQDIMNDAALIQSEYHAAYAGFKQGQQFDSDEMNYLSDVYNNLVSANNRQLDELTMVMTDSKLKMSDAERIKAIDRIYTETHGQLVFLRKFNNQASLIANQRLNGTSDKSTLQTLYQVK